MGSSKTKQLKRANESARYYKHKSKSLKEIFDEMKSQDILSSDAAEALEVIIYYV